MVANFYNNLQLWWSVLWCSKLSTSSLAFNYQWYILEWNINFRLPLRSVKNIKDKKTKLCLFYLLVHSDFILFFGNLTCLLNPDLKVATEKLCCELFENIIFENYLYSTIKMYHFFTNINRIIYFKHLIFTWKYLTISDYFLKTGFKLRGTQFFEPDMFLNSNLFQTL